MTDPAAPTRTGPSQTGTSQTDQTGPSRRTVLRSGCVVCAGALATGALAACGGDDPSDLVTTEADGSVRLPASAVEVGAAVYLSGVHVIVSQPTEGDYLAFDSTCPHQGCQVSMTGSEGELVCPCHDSAFDPASGDVLAGPATTGLTTMSVTVDGDDLVIRG